MIMVICLHILHARIGGVLSHVKAPSVNYYLAWLIESVAYCAVDCYALISGYIGVRNNIHIIKIIFLHLQVLFYSTIIFIIFSVIRHDLFTLNNAMQALFPVTSRCYWYFSSYYGAFFLFPLFNIALNKYTAKQISNLFIILILVFVIIPFIFQRDAYNLNNGYCLLWLALLYLFGGMLRCSSIAQRVSRFHLFILYLFCVASAYLFRLFGPDFIGVFGQKVNKSFILNYRSPCILFAAVSLVLLFSKMKITRGIYTISFFSSSSFAVYLIHENPHFRSHIMKTLFVNFHIIEPLYFSIAIIFSACGLFLTCALVDKIRIMLFTQLQVKKRVEQIERRFFM